MAILSTSNLKFTAIDVETANQSRSSICQVGIVDVYKGEVQDSVCFEVNPEEKFSSFNVGIHGIDEEAVKDSKTLPQIYDELSRRIGGTVLVSHSGFDRDALDKAANKYGLQPIQATWLDSSIIARHAWPKYKSGWRLKRIADDLDITFKHHDAGEDARVAAEIVLRACEHTGVDIYGWIESTGTTVHNKSALSTTQQNSVTSLAEVLKRVAPAASDGDSANVPPEQGPDYEDPVVPPEEEPDDSDGQCQLCLGRGWISPNVPVGHSDFGTITPCQCQESRLEGEQRDRLLTYSNLGHLTRFRFENLEPDGLSGLESGRVLFREAYERARAYADNPQGWLTFTGANGVGKTHLAAAIANHCIENGRIVFFFHAPDLLDHLRSSFGPASEVSYSDLFEQVRTTPLLVLDGLGSQTTTPWAQEKLRQVINHRYSAALPTVVTTAEHLEELDPYIRARLGGSVMDLGAQESTGFQGLGVVPPLLGSGMTFETFKTDGHNARTRFQQESLRAALAAAQEYARYPDTDKIWLTLSGNTGTGKTHLAVAIAVEQMEKGRSVFFAFVPELLDHLRATFSPESRVRYDRRFEEVKNTPLLILDGWGEEQSSPWAMDKLTQIIVNRHNFRLATIITTKRDRLDSSDPNHDLGPDESRVQDPTIARLVRIDARDYRRGYSDSSGGGSRSRRF